MKLFFSLIILITVLCTKLWSDSIVITTGNKIYYGEIIEENNSEIKLQTNDQTVIKIPKDNISSINPLLYKIVTISGATHIGSIVKENDSVLHLRNEEGIEFEIPKSQIEAKMIAEKHAKLANYQSHNDDYKPLQRTSYIPKEFGMIGLTLGTPGTVNLYLGYQTDFVGLSLEGGYYGLELNLGLRLHTTENSFINANALLVEAIC